MANTGSGEMAVDHSKLHLLKAKAARGSGATKWTAGGGFGAAVNN